MCVIAVSRQGERLPTDSEIYKMFRKNPDGAGFMFARNGKVFIKKGFSSLSDFYQALDNERLTEDDSIVYHFRIATQAFDVSMTQPFPVSSDLSLMKRKKITTDIGIAHNGIIRLTSNGDAKHSDTAIFVSDYVSNILEDPSDLMDEDRLNFIERLSDYHNKFAILDRFGNIATIGRFTEIDGILFSNSFWNYEEKRKFFF